MVETVHTGSGGGGIPHRPPPHPRICCWVVCACVVSVLLGVGIPTPSNASAHQLEDRWASTRGFGPCWACPRGGMPNVGWGQGSGIKREIRRWGSSVGGCTAGCVWASETGAGAPGQKYMFRQPHGAAQKRPRDSKQVPHAQAWTGGCHGRCIICQESRD